MQSPRTLRLFSTLLLPVSHMLQRVEMNGSHVDQERLYERMGILQGEIEQRKAGLNEHVSQRMLRSFPDEAYNYRSVQQTARLLFTSEKRGGLGLEPTIFTKTGNPSTNEEALQDYLSHPFITLLMQLRTLEGKWMNTYLLPW